MDDGFGAPARGMTRGEKVLVHVVFAIGVAILAVAWLVYQGEKRAQCPCPTCVVPAPKQAGTNQSSFVKGLTKGLTEGLEKGLDKGSGKN